MEGSRTTESPAVRWTKAKEHREELQAKLGLVAQAVGPGQDLPSPATALTAEAIEDLERLIKDEEEAYAEYMAWNRA